MSRLLLCARRFVLSAIVAVALSACSADDDSKAESGAQRTDHVLKAKTRTMDKARDVGRQIGEAAARQEKAAQRATQ